MDIQAALKQELLKVQVLLRTVSRRNQDQSETIWQELKLHSRKKKVVSISASCLYQRISLICSGWKQEVLLSLISASLKEERF